MPTPPSPVEAPRLSFHRRIGSAFERHQRLALRIGLAMHAIVMVTVFVSVKPDRYDFDRFWDIVSTPGRPYLDYQVERAPGEVAVMKGVSLVAPDRRSFGTGLVMLNVAADAGIIAALTTGWGVGAAAHYALVSTPLLKLLYRRIDLWSVVAATLAVAAWRRDRRVRAALAIAAGAALKLWPVTFAPLLWHARGRRPIPRLALVGGAASLVALWFAVAGSSGVLQVLTFRGARGWQIESVVGNLLELIGNPVREEAGADRTGWSTPVLSIAMFMASAPLSLWSMWRGARTGRIGTAWLAAVGVLLVFSALLSAQFIAWLIPAAAIAWTEVDRRSAALATWTVLLTQVAWIAYTPVVDGVRLAVLIVTTRNAVLVAMVATAMAHLARTNAGVTTPAAP